MTERVWNFSPGPAMLPLPVLERAREDVLSLRSAGASVLEISHRSRWFGDILEEAEANLRELLRIPDGYHVLFLQGGASLQFAMVPMSFLRGGPGVYLVTGSWGRKAATAARRVGDVVVPWDGQASGYTRVPRPGEYELPPGAAYCHLTSNETIQGVQWGEDELHLATDAPVVCDMSSDVLARPIPVDRFGLIYAGAQKNAGPAGVTIVIVRADLLERVAPDLPGMLDYRTHVDHRSGYNTPPVFAIHVLMLVTRWLRNDVGGLERMAERNRAKAALLYEAIDASDGFYRGHADPASRSLMNVTWRLPSEDLERAFLAEAEARGLVELKGHRSVGGVRASIYNAMPPEGVRALRGFMDGFRSRSG